MSLFVPFTETPSLNFYLWDRLHEFLLPYSGSLEDMLERCQSHFSNLSVPVLIPKVTHVVVFGSVRAPSVQKAYGDLSDRQVRYHLAFEGETHLLHHKIFSHDFYGLVEIDMANKEVRFTYDLNGHYQTEKNVNSKFHQDVHRFLSDLKSVEEILTSFRELLPQRVQSYKVSQEDLRLNLMDQEERLRRMIYL